MNQVVLREAERVEVTVLVDNHTDGLVTQNSEVVKRPRLALDQALLAEHGLSWLIKHRRFVLNTVGTTYVFQQPLRHAA